MAARSCTIIELIALVTYCYLFKSCMADSAVELKFVEGRVQRDTRGNQAVIDRLLANYDRNTPPGFTKNESTQVKVGIYVSKLKFLEDDEYEANIYLRQRWNDKRLAFSPLDNNNVTVIRLATEKVNSIWLPDTFIKQASELRLLQIPTPNIFLRLYSDGDLWLVYKVVLRSYCISRAKTYPMYTKVCSLNFESFGYTADVVIIKPLDMPIEIEDQLFLHSWKISTTKHMDCTQNYTTGSYPCLAMTMIFSRDVGYHLLNTYMPSALFVVVSWLALWIHSRNHMIAKLAPGLVALIGLMYLGSQAYDDLSTVSYIAPMHVWMGFSYLMVFLSLVKHAVVDKFMIGQDCNDQALSSASPAEIEVASKGTSFQHPKRALPARISGKYTWICRLTFPGVYLLFTFLYSVICSTNSETE